MEAKSLLWKTKQWLLLLLLQPKRCFNLTKKLEKNPDKIPDKIDRQSKSAHISNKQWKHLYSWLKNGIPYVNLEKYLLIFYEFAILIVSCIIGVKPVLYVVYSGFQSTLCSQSWTLSIRQLQAQIQAEKGGIGVSPGTSNHPWNKQTNTSRKATAEKMGLNV